VYAYDVNSKFEVKVTFLYFVLQFVELRKRKIRFEITVFSLRAYDML
jgi:hypothetical protein